MKKHTMFFGRGASRRRTLLQEAANRLKAGQEVLWIGELYPSVVIHILSGMGVPAIEAELAYNGQGRKLGEMVKPEGDTPIGWTLKSSE